MEAFAVGQIIANKTGNDEYAIVDVGRWIRCGGIIGCWTSHVY